MKKKIQQVTKVYKRPDAREVVEHFMSKPLDYTLWDTEKSEQKRREYGVGAKQILMSQVWMDESRRLIDLWVNEAACRAENYDQVRDLRMCINALVLLKERLEWIAGWDKKGPEESEDKFSGV